MEPIKANEILLEYRGEVIGNAMADKREKVGKEGGRRMRQEGVTSPSFQGGSGGGGNVLTSPSFPSFFFFFLSSWWWWWWW